MDKLREFLKKIDINTRAGPVLISLVLSMMVLPLPPLLLDIFFTFNIAISIIVLMVGVNTREPLEFSSFPTVL
ncbi:MAG: FHIPEP family type III secretion protein, partial [Vogesella sp.]|uniref:FHIPEP family type III secretion protein n=1 Tax=Vogesella sp. TaxID=1904252 RepID=UPI003F39203F